MPLWTILTKWPAPAGPQCKYPRSAVPSDALREGVGDAAARPGASAAKIGSSWRAIAPSPPIIMQKPSSRPHTPPLVPTST